MYLRYHNVHLVHNFCNAYLFFFAMRKFHSGGHEDQ